MFKIETFLKIIVGHELGFDFSALDYNPPEANIRDTAVYFHDYDQRRTPSLKNLAETKLGLTIQAGEHSSVEDAGAALRLYLSERKEWEGSVSTMQAFKNSNLALKPQTSIKNIWEMFKREDWTSLTDLRVRLVGQVGSVRNLKNVTFFDLRGDRVWIQVIDKIRADKLEKGQTVGVAGRITKGNQGYPLVADSDIRILARV